MTDVSSSPLSSCLYDLSVRNKAFMFLLREVTLEDTLLGQCWDLTCDAFDQACSDDRPRLCYDFWQTSGAIGFCKAEIEVFNKMEHLLSGFYTKLPDDCLLTVVDLLNRIEHWDYMSLIDRELVPRNDI